MTGLFPNVDQSKRPAGKAKPASLVIIAGICVRSQKCPEASEEAFIISKGADEDVYLRCTHFFSDSAAAALHFRVTRRRRGEK